MSEQNETGAAAGGGQMTVWDAIRSRRDVRAFDARPIPPADLDQILQAGRGPRPRGTGSRGTSSSSPTGSS